MHDRFMFTNTLMMDTMLLLQLGQQRRYITLNNLMMAHQMLSHVVRTVFALDTVGSMLMTFNGVKYKLSKKIHLRELQEMHLAS